jgi:CRISPR system Cascade subunit CasE
VLAYAPVDAQTLLTAAEKRGTLAALAALDTANVASKPMPTQWRVGQRVHLEVLTCPVSRQGKEEKDVYLRALDRKNDAAPSRAEVYRQWFARQWQDVVALERVDLLGMNAKVRLLRRNRQGGNRLIYVERPQALFATDAVICDPARFAGYLSRGIGRHLAFGFGMVLLMPPR